MDLKYMKISRVALLHALAASRHLAAPRLSLQRSLSTPVVACGLWCAVYARQPAYGRRRDARARPARRSTLHAGETSNRVIVIGAGERRRTLINVDS